MPGRVSMYFLGSPLVLVDGTESKFRSRKAIALLAYLVTTWHHHSRDRLVTLLWDETVDSYGRHRLSDEIYRLKQSIGDDDWLVSINDTVKFNRSPNYYVDLFDFEDLAEPLTNGCKNLSNADICNLKRAVNLYRDEFLSGFHARVSHDFEEWLLFERERLRLIYTRILDRLGNYSLRIGEYEQAITYGRLAVQTDSLNEEAHRLLISAYKDAGLYSTALQQYRKCEATIEKELGVALSLETKDLLTSIQGGSPVKRSTETQIPDSERNLARIHQGAKERSFEMPIVGRYDEYRCLEECLMEAEAGKGGVVIIKGEAGIGKTALAELFVEQKRDTNHSLKGYCYESVRSIPFYPLVQALRSYFTRTEISKLSLDRIWWMELARLMPEIQQRGVDLPPDIPLGASLEKLRLFDGIVQFLRALSQDKAVVLFFDDIHWIDPDTLEVLAYIGSFIEKEKLLIIGTMRDGGECKLLAQFKEELHQKGKLIDIPLSRLSPKEVSVLVQSLCNLTEPAPELDDIFYAETEGNPLFLVEWIRSLRDEVGLINESKEIIGILQEKQRKGKPSVPSRIKEIIQSRMRRLGEDARTLASIAAVSGVKFDSKLLEDLTDWPIERLLSAFDRLLQAQIFEESSSSYKSFFQFSHEKIQSVVYDDINPVLRDSLHRKIAIWHENYSEYDFAISHYLRAGKYEESANLIAREADEFLSSGRGPILEAWLQSIPPEVLHRNPWLMLYHARSLISKDQFVEAEKLLCSAKSQFQATGDKQGYAHALIRLSNLFREQGEYRQCVAFAEKALDELDKQDHTGRSQALLELTTALLETERATEGNDRASQLITEASLSNDSYLLGLATAHSSFVKSWFCDSDGAIKLAEDALKLLPQEHAPATSWALLTRGIPLYHMGRFEEAICDIKKSVMINENLADHSHLIMAFVYLGSAHREIEDYTQSRYYFERAMNLGATSGRRGYDYETAIGGLGLLGVVKRDRDLTTRCRDQLLQSGEAITGAARIFGASLCGHLGELTTAIKLLSEMAEETGQIGVHWDYLMSNFLLGGVLLQAGKYSEAEEPIRKALSTCAEGDVLCIEAGGYLYTVATFARERGLNRRHSEKILNIIDQRPGLQHFLHAVDN